MSELRLTEAALNKIDQIASNLRASAADALMHQAGQTTDRAGQTMNELRESMAVISASSHEVSGVLNGIDEIAFHTNIVALNAAVETARAAHGAFGEVSSAIRSGSQTVAEIAGYPCRNARLTQV